MFLEIVTPEASIFHGDVDSVIVPGVNGEFQMLNNHAPIVSLLQEGTIKIKGSFTIDEDYQSKFTNGENDYSELAIESGTVESNENKIIILVD